MFVRRRQENPFLSLPPSLSPRLAHLFVSVGKERRCPKQDRGGFAQKCLALQNLLIKQRGKKSQHVKTVWWEITTNIGRMSTSIFCALLLLRERAISSLLSVQPERERGNLWACQGRPRSSSSSSSDPPFPRPKSKAPPPPPPPLFTPKLQVIANHLFQKHGERMEGRRAAGKRSLRSEMAMGWSKWVGRELGWSKKWKNSWSRQLPTPPRRPVLVSRGVGFTMAKVYTVPVYNI